TRSSTSWRSWATPCWLPTCPGCKHLGNRRTARLVCLSSGASREGGGAVVDAINELLRANAGSVWVLPIVLALCTIDGFFPPLPSESIVVALAAVSASVGEPNMWGVFAAAALGAMLGDNIAYTIGRHGGVARLNDSNNRRVRAAMGWAREELARRGPVIIMAARYIPV